MRVLFMGTPDFAVNSLAAVFEAGFEICGVYTQPDKPRNRGQQYSFSPVKEYALSKGLSVYQPTSIKNPDEISRLKALAPDIVVVVAYGKFLTSEILEIPPLGVINVHGSLLPQYRGSAPIQWSVLRGEKETGVATMYMALKMDSGDVIDTAPTPIGEDETFGELYDRLKVLGAELLIKTLTDIQNGHIKRFPQDESLVTFAPPIQKEDCPIDWQKSADTVVNKVRGLNPKPCATARLGGTDFKIYQAKKTDKTTQAEPGMIVLADKHGLEVACGNGETVLVTELQASGGKRMSATSYLLGHKIEN